LRHGLFVVFVCGVLLINALTLAAGAGTATITIDVLILAAAAIWHAVGFVLRRKIPEKNLDYRWTPSANGHSRGALLLRHGVDMLRNVPRIMLRWFYATGRSTRLTLATFALPIVLAVLFPLLGPINFDFVPQVQTGEIGMTVTYPPGTPILVTEKYVTQLEDAIMKIDGIKSVSSTVGRKPHDGAARSAITTPGSTRRPYPSAGTRRIRSSTLFANCRISRRAVTSRFPEIAAAAPARRSSIRSPGPKAKLRPRPRRSRNSCAARRAASTSKPATKPPRRGSMSTSTRKRPRFWASRRRTPRMPRASRLTAPSPLVCAPRTA